MAKRALAVSWQKWVLLSVLLSLLALAIATAAPYRMLDYLPFHRGDKYTKSLHGWPIGWLEVWNPAWHPRPENEPRRYRVRWPSLIAEWSLFFVPIFLVVAGVSVLRQGPDRRPQHCRKCGFNLRGLDEPRCPECGTPFDLAILDRGRVFDNSRAGPRLGDGGERR